LKFLRFFRKEQKVNFSLAISLSFAYIPLLDARNGLETGCQCVPADWHREE
jgi:hypothetical protein